MIKNVNILDSNFKEIENLWKETCGVKMNCYTCPLGYLNGYCLYDLYDDRKYQKFTIRQLLENVIKSKDGLYSSYDDEN